MYELHGKVRRGGYLEKRIVEEATRLPPYEKIPLRGYFGVVQRDFGLYRLRAGELSHQNRKVFRGLER